MRILTNRGLGAAVLLMASVTAHAGIDCSGSHGGFRFMTSDSWTGTDKLEHFGVSAPFGALTGAWLAHWALMYSRDSRNKTFGLQYDNVF